MSAMIEGTAVAIETDLLKSLIENTRLLLQEKEWLAGTGAGNDFLKTLKSEIEQAEALLPNE